MGQFKLKRGYDIPLAGKAERRLESAHRPLRVAVLPIDFRGLRPALKIEEGSQVQRGSVLFVDKRRPEIKFLSPKAGTVSKIVRGERRIIQRIIVDVGPEDSAVEMPRYAEGELKTLTREQATSALLDAGLWPALRQRPYTRIAQPGGSPKAIFISAVDSAPLQAETDFILESRQQDFQLGVNVLSKLCDGPIHLSVSSKTSEWFTGIEGVDMHSFHGRHPSGNISVQVHHVDRMKSGELIWYISPRHVAQIGKILTQGSYAAEKIVALTGPSLSDNYYVKSIEGADISCFIPQGLSDVTHRFISGNVLTGRKTDAAGFLSYYDEMVTVVPEVQEKRFFGWVQPGFKAASWWPAFVSWFLPRKPRVINTDLNGEDRAFVATGNYERVLPMDILPSHLCKAILVEDVELMEQLGIYEVAPEDFSLCTYICPSKIEFESIIESGTILMEKEG